MRRTTIDDAYYGNYNDNDYGSDNQWWGEIDTIDVGNEMMVMKTKTTEKGRGGRERVMLTVPQFLNFDRSDGFFMVDETFPHYLEMLLKSILSSYHLTIIVFLRFGTVSAAAMVITYLT